MSIPFQQMKVISNRMFYYCITYNAPWVLVARSTPSF